MYSMNTPVKIKLKNKYGNLMTPRALSNLNTNIDNLTFNPKCRKRCKCHI